MHNSQRLQTWMQWEKKQGKLFRNCNKRSVKIMSGWILLFGKTMQLWDTSRRSKMLGIWRLVIYSEILTVLMLSTNSFVLETTQTLYNCTQESLSSYSSKNLTRYRCGSCTNKIWASFNLGLLTRIEAIIYICYLDNINWVTLYFLSFVIMTFCIKYKLWKIFWLGKFYYS